MEPKLLLTLDDEFIQFCKVNNITDIEGYAKEIFNKAFLSVKYGDKPKITPIKPAGVGTEALPIEEPVVKGVKALKTRKSIIQTIDNKPSSRLDDDDLYD
jgi:hypothetical protein